jgi:hypothetical protein
MTKLTLSAAFAGICFLATTAPAAPPGQGAGSTIGAAAEVSLVEQAHGCNRVCTLGRVRQWGGALRLHRHVGPACRPVRC